MTNNLITQDLDFETIKANLIASLKSQDTFRDHEFTGSGLNILLDTLAYNTHYQGYYAHMLANESFIESIIRKETMNSKAKLFNYLPKSKKSSKAIVTITESDPAPETNVRVDRGTMYAAKRDNPNLTDTRSFVLIDDLIIYYNADTSDYTSDEVTLYEGEFKTTDYHTAPQKRYVIRDLDIDTDTIMIKVKTNIGATEYVTYTQATDFTEIGSESLVYFISLNENDYYEFTFGNDIYGKSIPNDAYIEVSYVACNGERGNTVSTFESAKITVVEASTDGVERESLEDMRHDIPNHYRRQNRLVTVDDFKNIILSEYKNVSSLNVWGGEDNVPKSYGKVYICIQPKYGAKLSSKASGNLLAMLKKYTMATIESIIVDPEYLYVNLQVYTKNDTLKTSLREGELKRRIYETIETYGADQLNKFDSYYSDVKLNTAIMADSDSFITTYNNITLEKRFTPTLNVNQPYFVYFLNEVQPNSITSNQFTFRDYTCTLRDDGAGNIVVYYLDETKGTWNKFINETFGTVVYTTGAVKLSDITFTGLVEDDIKIFAIPVNPLFFAKLNTILVIDDVNINIENYHGRESEK